MHPTLRDRDLREHAALRLSRLLKVGVIFDQDVGDDHVRAHPRERQRVLAPEPARCTRDNRNSSCQVEHRLPP